MATAGRTSRPPRVRISPAALAGRVEVGAAQGGGGTQALVAGGGERRGRHIGAGGAGLDAAAGAAGGSRGGLPAVRRGEHGLHDAGPPLTGLVAQLRVVG